MISNISSKVLFPSPKKLDYNWKEWQTSIESKLQKNGYKKIGNSYKNEDFGFWKTVYDGDKKAYQLALLFFDFTKYNSNDIYAHRIGIQFEALLIGDARVDLSISNNLSLAEFEEAGHDFYITMKSYINERK